MNKVLALTIAIIVGFGLSISPIFYQPAHAATSHMKSAKVKWDLKNGKAVSCKEKIQLLGTKKVKVTVKNMKTTTLKSGMKKTTFTLVWQRNKNDFNPTKSQVDKIYAPFAYETAFAVVDYDTGKSLENNSAIAQRRGVDVKKVSNWKYANNVKRYGTKGNQASIPTKISVKLSITYPKSYKGLCLGVWMNDSKIANANNSFWQGTKTLKSTGYYKKFKSNMHWMRIK